MTIGSRNLTGECKSTSIHNMAVISEAGRSQFGISDAINPDKESFVTGSSDTENSDIGRSDTESSDVGRSDAESSDVGRSDAESSYAGSSAANTYGAGSYAAGATTPKYFSDVTVVCLTVCSFLMTNCYFVRSWLSGGYLPHKAW